MSSLATTDSGVASFKPTAGIAGGLGLAASPVFALMAAISSASASGVCAVGPPFLPISEMTLMYLLMSLFHMSPWLRFLPGRRAASPHTQMQGD